MKTIGELNREWFNTTADSAFKIPWVRALLEQITDFLRGNVEWIGLPAGGDAGDKNLKMLDYACGNGVASTVIIYALASFVSTLRGIDISDGMVEQYNNAARSQGLSGEQMRAVQGDLLAHPEKLDSPDLFNFDVIVISAALHHVEDPAKMVQRLAERLASGGSLVVVDGVAASESGCAVPNAEHPAAHTVSRKQGFTKQEILDMFSQAGLVDADYRWHPQRTAMPDEFGGEQQIFFARAKKA
ncbi:hypothetical protein NKR23_g1117 [Pleurostoma richardsiae]|uniref:Methyltransferase domain-containing protein n=1 Tax=Pleurostoma richardsiae TaxID=41990 RepID=A0AA38S5C3_9PEZI|nr:hypothetical protein NKR23_g1117 [Pleurostoma richardsiae]